MSEGFTTHVPASGRSERVMEPGRAAVRSGRAFDREAVLRAREHAWRVAAAETRSIRLDRGDILLRSGARFEGLYVIRAGSCKRVTSSPDGEEHIAAFSLAGEVLGLEAVASGVHETTVYALEPMTCWHLPREHVDALLHHDLAFAQTLVHALSLETGRGIRGMLLLGTMTADQRVTSFLLDLADRYHGLGFSGSAFELRMTRAEIGSHLGISTETVSRVLSRLRADNLAIVNGRSVHLRDRTALGRILLHRD